MIRDFLVRLGMKLLFRLSQKEAIDVTHQLQAQRLAEAIKKREENNARLRTVLAARNIAMRREQEEGSR